MLLCLLRKGIYFATLLCVVVSLQVFAHSSQKETAASGSFLVDGSWLLLRLHKPGLVILDARSPAEYGQGHIVGAINFPAARTHQEGSDKRVVPQFEIEESLGRLGISNDSQVVIYGDAGYQDAARVFWALDLYGHRNLSLLNGAYPAWQAAGLPVDKRLLRSTPVTYRASIHPGRLATRLQTLLAMENPRIAVIDAREAAEFQGIKSSTRRYGHIPGAINIPGDDNLEIRQGITYIKSAAELAKLYAGINSYGRIILYCNFGCDSAINYLALRVLDKDVGLYDGAWQEWGNDSSLPITSTAP